MEELPALLEKWGWTSPTLIFIVTLLVNIIRIKLTQKGKITDDVLTAWLNRIPKEEVKKQTPEISLPEPIPHVEKKVTLSDEKDAIMLIGELRSVKLSKEGGQTRIRIAGNFKVETTSP